jgi:hypothetical protein
VWIFINNPGRSTDEDLNLTVGFTTKLNTEALRLLGEELMTVKIDVMDEDTFSEDKLMTDQSFQIGIHDTDFHCWHTGVIVPHQKLNDCEPFYESQAEIYCRVSAKGGGVQTNAEIPDRERSDRLRRLIRRWETQIRPLAVRPIRSGDCALSANPLDQLYD